MRVAKHTIRALLLWRTLQLLGGLALMGAVVVMVYLLRSASINLIMRQRAAEGVLETSVYDAALKAELARRVRDVERIDALIVRRARFADFITVLESHAQRHGVSLHVSSITEGDAAPAGAAEESAEASPATLAEVHVHFAAEGTPRALLNFLHAVEHLPYVVELPAWEFAVHAPGVSRQKTASPPGAPGSELKQDDSRLIVELVVATLPEGATASTGGAL